MEGENRGKYLSEDGKNALAPKNNDFKWHRCDIIDMISMGEGGGVQPNHVHPFQ